MKFLLALALFVTSASAASFANVVGQEWEAWKGTHAKEYSSVTEETFRMKIYRINKASWRDTISWRTRATTATSSR